MRIGHCIFHSCSRVHKLATAQVAHGDKCYLVNALFGDGHPWHVYELVARIFQLYDEGGEEVISGEHIKTVIKELDDKVDIWHCHNQPDWWVPLVKQVTKKPVVYDVHDLTSLVSPERCTSMENESFRLADGIMTVSDGYLKLIREKIGQEKPAMVYQSMMPKAWNRSPAENPYFDLVYAGGLLKGRHRDWRKTFKWIVDQGVKMHVLPTTKKSAQEYKDSGVGKGTVLDPQPYDKMLGIIKNSVAGLVGSPEENEVTKHAIPNKFYEYLACGIPVIAMNMPDLKPIIQDNGLGEYVSSKYEILSALNRIEKDLKTYRENVEGFSLSYSMDSQLPQIKMFYQMLIHRAIDG